MILRDKIYAGWVFFFLFVDRGDLAYFDGLSETILAVGLVKPKAGKEYMTVIRIRQLLRRLYMFFRCVYVKICVLCACIYAYTRCMCLFLF